VRTHVRNFNHIIKKTPNSNKEVETLNDGMELINKAIKLNDKSIQDTENNILLKLQNLNQNFQCTENQTRGEIIAKFPKLHNPLWTKKTS
jgi:hypothetical protein